MGAPWEIQRATRDTLDQGIVDLYTKSGSTGTYNSIIVLIPDYDVAFTVLVAGDVSRLVNMLSEMVAQAFLPTFYRISKQEAAGAFGGVYQSTGAVNTSLSLIEDDGPGLLVEKWISKGTDLLAAFQPLAGAVAQARVYPTGLRSPAKGNNSTTEVAWRGIFQPLPAANSTYRHEEIFNNDGDTWVGVDAVTYGRNSLDEFVFQVDQNGNAISVEPRALRIDLVKRSPMSNNASVTYGG